MQLSTRRFFNSPAPGGAPPPAPQIHVFLAMLRLTKICREKPVFAGKVTCGVRNETSGQSWLSNTVATDPFTGQNRNEKCGSGIQHKRLGGWRPKTLDLLFQTLRYIGMAARGVLSSVPFSPINLDKVPSTAAMDVGLARLPATARLPARKPRPVDR